MLRYDEDEKYCIAKNSLSIPRKLIPRKLQFPAIFGDPRNFNASKIPCLTVTETSGKTRYGNIPFQNIQNTAGLVLAIMNTLTSIFILANLMAGFGLLSLRRFFWWLIYCKGVGGWVGLRRGVRGCQKTEISYFDHQKCARNLALLRQDEKEKVLQMQGVWGAHPRS